MALPQLRQSPPTPSVSVPVDAHWTILDRHTDADGTPILVMRCENGVAITVRLPRNPYPKATP